MTHCAAQSKNRDNVISLFSRKPIDDPASQQLIRIVPELDHLCMVYSHPHDPGSLFAVPLIGWGLRQDEHIVGVIPWLTSVISAEDANDPKGGVWQGYYDPESEVVFSEAPEHKVQELKASLEAYEFFTSESSYIMQEIPDTTGTHALTLLPEKSAYQLSEIYSWALFSDGRVEAMLVDEDKVVNTPVLPGDDCLFPFSELEGTSYYFQYKVANQIKREEPEALAALQRMMLCCQMKTGE